MSRTALTLLIIAGALSACASRPSFNIPFMSRPTVASDTPFHRDPHRQYYDQLHKRYYYYDPDRKAYFWENGDPKA